MKKFTKFNRNIILSILLLAGIAFSVIKIVTATTPNPGHAWSEVGDGFFAVSGPASTVKTFTLPNYSATILTDNAAVTVAQGGTGLGTFGGANAVLYTSAADTLTKVAASTAVGQFLQTTALGGAPTWLTTLGVANGGTGLNSIATNDLIYGAGTSAASLLAPGATTGAVLMNTASGAPSWVLLNALPSTANTLPVANGGTGLTTFGGTNAVLYTSAADTLTKVAASTAIGQFLQTSASGGAPTWLTTLGIANGGTGLNSIATNDLIYGAGTSAASLLAPGATTGAVLMNTASGAPSWVLLNALPSTANTLPVANGGTGLTASVSDAVLVGDSTSAYTARTLPASCAGTTAKLLYDSTTNTFSCGTDQTSGGGATYVVTTADSASAAVTTYANITGLSWTVNASTRYDIYCNIIYDASATTIGLGIGWTGPASPTRTRGKMVAGLSGGVTVGGTASVGNDTGLTTASSVYTASNTATFEGVWENGSTAGTLQMRFKPETATASGIVIKIGSWCKYLTY